MTINDANRLVLALVGEDDFHDVEDVLTSYYDLAQLEIATTVSPIEKSFVAQAGTVELPLDVFRLKSIDAGYTRIDKRNLKLDKSGVIKYYAYPIRLKDDTSGDTEFEISPEAQRAIPYYAAARIVLADSDMRRYYAFMDMYNSILASISASNNSASVMTVIEMEGLANV